MIRQSKFNFVDALNKTKVYLYRLLGFKKKEKIQSKNKNTNCANTFWTKIQNLFKIGIIKDTRKYRLVAESVIYRS